MDALKEENLQLLKQINELKLKLGVFIDDADKDMQKARETFDMFDTDKNGFITRDEFDVLAFECNADINSLTPAKLDQEFKEVNKSGDGKVSFEQFYEWLTSNKQAANANVAEDVGMLRLKLQSKSWMKNIESVKSTIQQTKSEGKVSREGKAPDPKKISYKISVGDMKVPQASISFLSDSPMSLAQMRADVECPETVDTFVAIDFNLRKDVDEMRIGELFGMIDVVVDALPLDAIPGYHSHTIGHFEDDENNQFLRIVVFSSINVNEVIGGFLLGKSGDDVDEVMKSFYSGSAALELGFDLDRFAKDPNRPFLAEDMSFCFHGEFEVNSELLHQSEKVVDQLPPDMAYRLRMNLAYAIFVKRVEFALNFGSIADFLQQFENVNIGAVQALRGFVTMAEQTAIGNTIKQATRGLAPFLQAQQELVNTIIDTVSGLHQVYFCVSNSGSKVVVKGLDFIPFFEKAVQL